MGGNGGEVLVEDGEFILEVGELGIATGEVAEAAGHFEGESGLDDGIDAEIGDRAFEGVGGAFERLRVSRLNRGLNGGQRIGVILEEELSNFLKKGGVAADAIESDRFV